LHLDAVDEPGDDVRVELAGHGVRLQQRNRREVIEES
jgi:hypothetical protein